ncbi:MAG TPA: hypothetical protein VFZ11_06190 [Gemmatimonadaceae bacterium]
MPLREFTDRTGEEWRVWDITPDRLHPSSRAGDYLQGFVDGWLVFEPARGGEKRRLYPVPVDWQELSDEALDLLCQRAESVRAGGRARTSGDHDAVRDEHEAAGSQRAPDRETDPRSVTIGGRPTARTFLYPGGRVWTVAEQYIQLRDRMGQPLDARTVLRFTSGTRSLDLLAWPPEWTSYSDRELADLLGRAFPRDRSSSTPSEHRRRHTDQRA